MNGSSSWIEPPPPQRGLGCFAKGCLILCVFFILLGLAFVAGTYYAAKFVRSEYFSSEHERLPISQATVEEETAAHERWDAFEKAARAHEPARIEMTADDLNAVIASDRKLRGDAYVTIEDNSARLQVSIPVGTSWWLRGRYINAQCTIESAPSGKPEDARITSIVVNGRPVGEEFLTWQYGSWSFKRYVTDWTGETNLKRFEIADGKVILETGASSDDPFASPLPAASPSPTPTLQLESQTPEPSPSNGGD
ncbi:MAG TPA: hypothetical protein VEH26_02390 [Chthoniobacterales bacterium]|nr:hypothetical protein [Chthoniobacterales bacterium]